MLNRLGDFFWSDPLRGLALAAALIALATTPIAFAILGRLDYFYARRGRVLQKPSFASVVVGMMLVMGIPAIFCALVVKSQYFDKNRYEFDPNHTWTLLDQGRGYQSREEINAALRSEMDRLATERKNLVESVKKLDEAMIALRSAAQQAPAVSPPLGEVLQRLARVHQAIGLDGPQQLIDLTAPPVDLAATSPAAAPVASAPSPVPAAPASAGVLASPEIQANLAAVPDAQKPLAAMLPLVDLPAGWTIGHDMGPTAKGHLETFNAENLYEKIDGRAESFIQYDVRGMAYTYYHPVGDDSGEVQLYIFEMGSPLKALGKYSSEKGEELTPVAVGEEGYSSAGSLFFRAGPYYTQLVTNKDDPKYAAFALELAKRVAARQQPQLATAGHAPAATSGATAAQPASGPEAIFALLPPEPKRSSPKFVAQDVFGYSFLSDVFMADYQDGDVSWQGFLRPYADPDAARAAFEKYVESAKQDGAEMKMFEAEGADRMVVCANVGLIDVVFLKGNAVGGANGATKAEPAEAFARKFAKDLPAKLPTVEEKPAGSGSPHPAEAGH